jgi:hypothetical protein
MDSNMADVATDDFNEVLTNSGLIKVDSAIDLNVVKKFHKN